MITDLDQYIETGKKAEFDWRARGLTLALGFFDGMHLGHGALMDACLRQGARDGSVPAVLLLEPHPLRVLAEGSAKGSGGGIRTLNGLREKIYFIRRHGVGQVFLKAFDREFARLAPEDFVQRYLVDLLGVRNVTVGFNYRFGARGMGTPGLLENLAQQYDFGLRVVQPVYLDGQLVSSTLIREKVEAGDMEAAARLMGHPHLFSGRVTEGNRLGRQWGFPTANLPLDPTVLTPPLGVYAARVEIAPPEPAPGGGFGEVSGGGDGSGVDGGGYRAVVNIGTRPTVAPDRSDVTLEAHLLDFDGDLYGKEIRVFLLKHMRNERRFEDTDALKAQVARDIETARDEG
jgi:riboflavin kinase/FMN adenylyltransferase